MTEPTNPTKKEMLEYLENCSGTGCCDCPLRNSKRDCNEIKDAIRALIESATEPGVTPPSGSMTDDLQQLVTWLDNAPYLMGKLTEGDKAMREKIIARLSQKPKVTRERVNRLEHHFLTGMDIPDLKKASNEIDWVLDILGLEVEEEKS